MIRIAIGHVRAFATLSGLLLGVGGVEPALAQKSGGTLKIYSLTSPASMSPMEEATAFATGPMMGVFNNLVLFDQHVPQNSLQSIRPDLATGWSWSADQTALTFPLRQGIKWHDGKPFTAKDVECSWNLLLEKSTEKLRVNPRKAWYLNLDRVTPNGDHEVTFHLKRPQPAFLMLLAGGVSAVYPCHVPPERMRKHPIGTGPFKFVSFEPNQHIKVTRNPNYWKPGRPYLDAIEYTIIRNVATAQLGFASGTFDMTFPQGVTVPQLKDLRQQAPQAMCEILPNGINSHVLINRTVPPFDNAELRRAISLSVDRKAFIDILSEGQGDVGGVLQPPPGGQWGMPPEMLRELPGYDADVTKNRAQARTIMEKLGYGPAKRLKVKLTTRDLNTYRDPAVILLDHLKEIYIDAELELVETAAYFPKIYRRDFVLSLNLQTSGPDPDQALDIFYGCSSLLNWDGYCNAEVDKLIEQKSIEGNEERRKKLVWEVERRLAEDGARPIISYSRGATCWHPYVKGLSMMVNSFFNGHRHEDVWLDK